MTRRMQAGFNVIELVLVIVLVSALAVFAFPRLNTSGFDRYAFREEVIGAAQYAQKLALASGCQVRVRVTTGQYELDYRADGDSTTCGSGSGNFTEPVPAPGGGDYENDQAQGVTAGATVIFGNNGVPLDTNGDPKTNDATIEFKDGQDVIIERKTGYVHQ